MNKNLIKEIQNINYLFGYKKGVVISEQTLPEPESDSAELGKVNPSTKQEMENLVNQNPEKYQMAEYTGVLPESQAKSKACLMAGRKFGSGNFNVSQHPIYDRSTKVAYCLVAKK